MKILSIETSCDETAVAALDITGPLEKPDIKILGNTLLSQVPLHEQYGGVFPMLAKREHEKNLPVLLDETMKKAGNPEVDFIAVTAGPGLEPALWAGITFAEDLGKKWAKPVVPVNHMQGHIWSVLFHQEVKLPALALLVSGGHTELVLVRDFGDYEILGRTLDDAVGEAFDKVARMLGLHYPGGPKISALAEKARARNPNYEKLPRSISFPRPMIHSGDLNFSYSGLKTAVLYKTKADNKDDEEYKEDIARAFEEAAIEVLISKTRKALEESSVDIKSLIVGGGVAANKHLGQKLSELMADFPDISLRVPERALTTDNAVMIGIAAYVEVAKNPSVLIKEQKIAAKGNLSIDSSSR